MMTIYHSNGIDIISLIFLCIIVGKFIGGIISFYMFRNYIIDLETELDFKNEILRKHKL